MSTSAPIPALDFSYLLKDVPRGAWVAISVGDSGAEVVSYGSDLQDVLSTAKDSGELEPVVMRVPETPSSLML